MGFERIVPNSIINPFLTLYLACQGEVLKSFCVNVNKIHARLHPRLRRGSLPLRVRLVNGLPRRSSEKLRFSERRLVEAAGVEPASENIPQWRLHAYPEL